MDWAEALWTELAENETQPFSKERTISALRKAKAYGYLLGVKDTSELITTKFDTAIGTALEGVNVDLVLELSDRASQIEKGN